MLSASKPLAQVQLGTGLTDIYVNPDQPPGTVTEIDALWIANTDSAAHTVTLRVGTGTLTAANSLGEAWAILANETFILGVGMVILRLQPGQKLQGLADSASKITVSVYGVVIS
jgi:hypothetical protein